MTKSKLPINLGVEQSIAGENDVNRLSCVRPELGEFATLFITNGGMKRADVERFKLYTGLSRHVLYRVL